MGIKQLMFIIETQAKGLECSLRDVGYEFLMNGEGGKRKLKVNSDTGTRWFDAQLEHDEGDRTAADYADANPEPQHD